MQIRDMVTGKMRDVPVDPVEAEDPVLVGDVVLAPMPFTDMSVTKVRPAVALADVGMQDWVLCQITSSPRARDRRISIDPSDMTSGRLKFQSWARPDRIYTINERVFGSAIGRVSAAKRSEIAAAVRSLF